MNPELTAEEEIIHAVITNDRGDIFMDEGYEYFDDAVDAMMNKWNMLTVQERVTIAKRDYCDITGADYMAAVGFYDEETGESEYYTSLAEEIARREEIEEDTE